ncbi:hypothetical protein [Candidatus Magnetomonas plexicatena]|uniref:hypothetical protein n=1 Tax=Candidatus Magnetomonas plexicatena TaxID=2552947 RepID=UPI001C7619A9|nr:hypothetical protein E2O03_004045 [Nitrospirales bacterium LBB_01]
MDIKLTKHAAGKIRQRGIKTEDIDCVVNEPLFVEFDRFDNTLKHFVGFVNDKYLRVIGRNVSEETLLIISVFYDRRLKSRREQ